MIREFDESGDIKSGTFFRGQDSVGANIATQIQLWARENPLNLLEGIDWQLELSELNTGRLSAQIRDIAFSCANVTAVSKYINFTGPDEDRILYIDFRVNTTFGELSVGVPVDA